MTIAIRCLVLAALLHAGCGSAMSAPSGVSGKVTVAPTCPGGQRLDEECRGPLAHARVALIDGKGVTVATAQTSADGRFEISAAAGSYRLEVVSVGRLPRCPPIEITVTGGRQAAVEITCDSGMR